MSTGLRLITLAMARLGFLLGWVGILGLTCALALGVMSGFEDHSYLLVQAGSLISFALGAALVVSATMIRRSRL